MSKIDYQQYGCSDCGSKNIDEDGICLHCNELEDYCIEDGDSPCPTWTKEEVLDVVMIMKNLFTKESDLC